MKMNWNRVSGLCRPPFIQFNCKIDCNTLNFTLGTQQCNCQRNQWKTNSSFSGQKKMCVSGSWRSSSECKESLILISILDLIFTLKAMRAYSDYHVHDRILELNFPPNILKGQCDSRRSWNSRKHSTRIERIKFSELQEFPLNCAYRPSQNSSATTSSWSGTILLNPFGMYRLESLCITIYRRFPQFKYKTKEKKLVSAFACSYLSNYIKLISCLVQFSINLFFRR